MGTPAFAATVLQSLCRWEGGELVGVYCQPDKPAGRGHKLSPSPVKRLALEKGLPVFQPSNFRAEEDCVRLASLEPDILAVAAYGLILPQTVLDIPRMGPLNVHGSLLPRYRGAAPIQRAIMDGGQETGVSIMRIEAGLDSGPVYAARAMPIGEHTAGSLHDALALLGGDLLVDVLERLRAGTVEAVPQDNALATRAPKLTKADGVIDWRADAAAVHARIRACTPWPGARTRVFSESKGALAVILEPGRVLDEERPSGMPEGTWRRLESGEVAVAAGDRFYALKIARPENRKSMEAAAFANGYLDPVPVGQACGRWLEGED